MCGLQAGRGDRLTGDTLWKPSRLVARAAQRRVSLLTLKPWEIRRLASPRRICPRLSVRISYTRGLIAGLPTCYTHLHLSSDRNAGAHVAVGHPNGKGWPAVKAARTRLQKLRPQARCARRGTAVALLVMEHWSYLRPADRYAKQPGIPRQGSAVAVSLFQAIALQRRPAHCGARESAEPEEWTRMTEAPGRAEGGECVGRLTRGEQAKI